MIPHQRRIRAAAKTLLDMGIGLTGYDSQGDEFNLPTPEVVVAYLQANKARYDLCQLLKVDDLELKLVPKEKPAPAG